MPVRIIDAQGEPQVYDDAEGTRLLADGTLVVLADLQDDPSIARPVAVYPPRGWRRTVLEAGAGLVQLPEEPQNPQESAGAGRSPFDSITLTYGELRQLIGLHLEQAARTMGRTAPWLDLERDARAMRDGETPLRLGEVLGLPHPVLEPTQQREPRPAAEEPLVLFDRDPETLSAAVHQAGGAFSVCWDSMAGTGVFQDGRARAVADQLLAWIEERYEPRRKPRAIDRTLAPELLSQLRELGDHYGPLGVALAAAELTEPLAVIGRLRAAETLTEHDATDMAERKAEELLGRGLLTASADDARSAIARAIRLAASGGSVPARLRSEVTEAWQGEQMRHLSPESQPPSPDSDGEPLDSQVARLATWIIDNVPGEPSRPEGAVDCALRLLRERIPSLPPTLHDGDRLSVEDSEGRGIAGRVLAWTAAPGGHPFTILCGAE